MNSFNIVDIVEDTYCTADVYLDKKSLILPEGTQYTTQINETLKKWEFKQLYTKGSFVYKRPHEETKKLQNEKKSEKKATAVEEKKMAHTNIIDFYNDFITFTANIYDQYKTKKTIDAGAVIERMKQFCIFVRKNKQRLLILQSMMPYSDKNYIISHVTRSTVFAIVIGLQLDLKQYQLFELATACLLHQIGLTQLPEALYMQPNILSAAEKKSLSVYPLVSFKILKAAYFPAPICMAVLDQSERKDGSGFPQKLTGNKISIYGKIIAVASSYEAIIAPRKYKTTKIPAIALNNLIKNDKDQYDGTVLKALLYALSMFPIGTYVVLSNKTIAQVIDANTEDPRFPVVRTIAKKGTDEEQKIIKTNSKGISILRPAHKKEVSTGIVEK